MLKAFYLVLLLLTLFAADLRAQVPEEPATEPAVITSTLTGATFVIERRTPQAGIKPASTRHAAGTTRPEASPSRLDGLTPEQRGILEKLNRADRGRLARLGAVVIPAAWQDDELAYSPFPQTYAWAADKPQTIVVDQVAQAFGAYEHGRLVRWGPVSTGEGGKTPAGVFQLSWRSRGHRSSVDPSWYLEWYFNFIPAQGIAFHKYSLPGRAASHGCVRMLERDAQWLFDWGTAARSGAPGTTVVVLGCPDSTKVWQAENFLRTGISLPASPETAKRTCVGYSGAASASYRKTVR
jgi:lipoprotein-anchoring transpeptidase ErfK/SrfK